MNQLVSQAQTEGRFDEAIEYQQYNLEQNPGSGMAHYLMAETFKSAGKRDLAIKYYQRAIALKPSMAGYVTPLIADLERSK